MPEPLLLRGNPTRTAPKSFPSLDSPIPPPCPSTSPPSSPSPRRCGGSCLRRWAASWIGCRTRPAPICRFALPRACRLAVDPAGQTGNYASDNSTPPPAINSKPAQPITEGRSPRKANPTKATINRLSRSTGTTNDASPCFRALKKQNDDKPLARPESTMKSKVCWDNANGLLIFPDARMSSGRKIAMTTVRIKVARSASIPPSPILPNTADALAQSADKNAHINQSGRAGIGLI